MFIYLSCSISHFPPTLVFVVKVMIPPGLQTSSQWLSTKGSEK
jgi:hypothetical protein